MGLLYVEHQPFEVLALGVVDVDGVVGGLGELVEDADLASGDGGGGEDRGAEQLLTRPRGVREMKPSCKRYGS